VKRPEQHIIDSQADAIFRAAFSEWAINPSEQDYGWDYVVEVFRDGVSTGLTFYAQLKGSRNTSYSADGTFISQSLERSAADYLARELRQPVFLFHADVSEDRLFWNAIQLDPKVSAALETRETQTVTVRINTANVLPQFLGRFLDDLAHSQTVVASRILLGTKAGDLVEAMRGHPVERVVEVATDLHEKAFRLDLQAAHTQMQQGNLTGAIATVKKVASSSTENVETHFNAVLQLGELEVLQLMKSEQPQSLVADRSLATAEELCRIANRVPKHLHLFARAMRQAGKLGVAVQKTFGLLLSWRGHVLQARDPLWIAVVSGQLSQGLVAVDRSYRQSLRLAQAIARSRFRWVAPRPIVSIAVHITTLATLLDSAHTALDAFQDAAREYRASAFQLFKFAASIAIENEDMDELVDALSHARMVEQEESGEVFTWIRSIICSWPEASEYRRTVEGLLRRWVARKEGATFEGDVETTPRQIHQNILTSAGIDPRSEPWTSYIDLAIKYDDPTRILRFCRHKTALPHPVRDPILDRLGLERANPKIVACALHRVSLAGRDLDGIDGEFLQRNCKDCVDRAPRSADWTYYDTEPPR
jgi:hypothetical protein